MFIWYVSDRLRETRENRDTWLWTRVPCRLREKVAARQKHLPHLQILGIDRRLISGISIQNHFPVVVLRNYLRNIVEAMLFCLYQAMLFCLYPACQNYVLLRHVCLSNSYIRSCCWLFDHGSRAVNVTMYIFLTKLNVKSCWLTSKLIILLPVGERFFFFSGGSIRNSINGEKYNCVMAVR